MNGSGFTKKRIELTITLGSGQFGEDVGDTVTISDARIMCDLVNPGGESMGMCNLRVWGLKQSTMNKLTTIGTINRAVRVKNTIAISAGDTENGMQLVFKGVIYDAWADYNGSPDVPFIVVAYAGLDIAVKPVDSTSFAGSTSVATIMQKFAEDAGLSFEDNGVKVQLSNPYFSGDTLNKIRMCARAAGINYTIDRGTLAIWGTNQSRQGNVPAVGPDSGMVGYPSLSSKGVTVRMVFNWNVKLGGDIKLTSSIPMANGTWRVFNVSHSLSSELPDGPWFTTADCYHGGQQ